MNEKLLKKIIKLRHRKLSNTDISKIVNLHRSTVGKYLKNQKGYKPYRNRVNKEKINRLKKRNEIISIRYIKGDSMIMLSTEFNLCIQQINNILNKLKVKKRKRGRPPFVPILYTD